MSDLITAPSGLNRQILDARHHQASGQYLTCMVGSDQFGLAVLAIREIFEFGAVTEVPMMPAYVRGILNLRGAVVPVLDLNARFGRARSSITRRSCIVIVEVGSEAGAEVLAELPCRVAQPAECVAAADEIAAAATRMGRQMPERDLRQLLVDSRESQHWSEVASRCLTCGNCTMVCPTCFCTSTEDVTDLTGEHAQRWMEWASCFELDFTFVHEGPVRASGESRYRHWLTHKLSTWHDQFASSGCVGCGRCIAWCPTGIDITEEMGVFASEHSEETATLDTERTDD